MSIKKTGTAIAVTKVYDQIKEKFIMRNAWDDWRDYREELTSIVNAHAGESIAIVGAGQCNDVDLEQLAFDKITLIDANAEALKDAVKRLPEHLQANVSVVEASLTNISEKDAESFCENVLEYVRKMGRSLSAEVFEACLNEELERLENWIADAESALAKALPEATYDVVLCSGVCSQLFTTLLFFIRSVAHSVAVDIFPEACSIGEKVEGRLSSMNDRVIPRIASAIVGAARKTVIFGNEDSEREPVEGAYQCIRYIRENYKAEERVLSWNFNPAADANYRMVLQIVERTI